MVIYSNCNLFTPHFIINYLLGIHEIPDSIKCCKRLSIIEASVNPIGRLPEGFMMLISLSELYLNDTFLEFLPGSFGR
jgi:Leucine-rich repeat (LRR) protein